MKKEYSIYIEDMLESIEHISNYLEDKSEVQFSQNLELQDAIVRRLGIIGEAATRLTADIRKKAPNIPWKSVIGLRNIVIHEYAKISLNKVWDVVKNDLPSLKKELEKLLLILKNNL